VLLSWGEGLKGVAGGANRWWLPNPDPRVTDEGQWLRNRDGSVVRDEETGLPLVRGRARAKQRPPPGDWFVWVYMGGRGTGKTRSGTEWLDLRARARRSGQQVLLAGRTPSDVRDYALYGRGGLLTHHKDIEYSPSARTLTWPNGVVGLIRSGANPEEFRGYSGDTALLDEFAAWDYPQACWENLMFGVREDDPQIAITTTPRPLPVIKTIIAMPATVVVRGSSYENMANLSEKWVRAVLDPLVGTRLGRQEIDAELLEEVEGALWTLAGIDNQRVMREHMPRMLRVVVGVDPQGTKAPGHMTGVVVAGIGADMDYYVLHDGSINGTPGEWGHRAVAVYDRWEADRILGEKNFGGEMVEHTIRTVRTRPPVAFSYVTASRGKRVRAEPVSALYEKGRVHHVGSFPALEDEMCGHTPLSTESPNRMDGLVWAVTELMTNGVQRKVGLTW
jgi:phage terminase large subunit-like protein